MIAVDAAGRALDPAAAAHSPVAEVRKLAGVLGETDGLGSDEPRAVVGIGVNADWPAEAFPLELVGTMTSLRSASGGRRIDLAVLLDAFVSGLETRVHALFGGRFDAADWNDRQITTGRRIRLELPDGRAEDVLARGVDALTGALVIEGDRAGDTPSRERSIVVGEIRHVRLGV